MKKAFQIFVLLVGAIAVASPAFAVSDDEVKKMVIQESINAYSGSCACPYNRARNGSKCGKRSAWSRPGGASPICYPNEVSDEMVKAYRKKHNIK